MDEETNSRQKLVIIGGGAVGMAVATHTKRHGNYSITVISKDEHTAYSQCGIPFVLGGEIEDFDKLIVKKPEFFEQMGINIRLNTTVNAIDIDSKTIHIGDEILPFDKLVIATGSYPHIPENIKPYSQLENVHTLRTLSDGMKIQNALKDTENLTIIGGGSIGVEVAASAAKRGINTTLVNRNYSLLSHNIDPDMSEIVRSHLVSMGIEVITDTVPESINCTTKVKSVTIDGTDIPTDTVIISAGVLPDTSLVRNTKIKIGKSGGIVVDEQLQVKIGDTFHTDVFSGGECAEVYDLTTGEPFVSQLGSTARRMAAVIANNLCGTPSTFGAIINPWVCVAGKLQVGSVGLTSRIADKSGKKIITGMSKGLTRATYYPGGSQIFIKLIFSDRYLVGAQVIAGEGVKERIDGLAFAIRKRATIDEMLEMETCYAPPVSMLIDPIMYAIEDAHKKM
ncbi:MAG: FAD-dependent oxidoreductase [Methanosarcinaceae archaeon]|nr:FAD-dependent oxidoreductase [Methanosarcinaceae archaeon]